MRVEANEMQIEVSDTGGSGPAVLLVSGLGMQLVDWPTALMKRLVKLGFRVICYDNRDMGLSQYLDCANEGAIVSLWRTVHDVMGGIPYTVEDLAADAVGVLDALDVQRAHVVGVSMGGMIAQRVAIAAPDRVLSLTSAMSSSGAPMLPLPRPTVTYAMLSMLRTHPDPASHFARFLGLIGGPRFPVNEKQLHARAKRSLQRAWHPTGIRRQMLAVATDLSRAWELPKISAPTLVLHGRDDPLVPLACGIDTARRIKGARMEVIDGMGHDIPQAAVNRVLSSLLPHLETHGLSD